MTDPADHSVRSLADILREHGLESEAGTRPGTTGPQTGQRRRRAEDQPGDQSGGTGGDRRRTGGRRASDAASAPPPDQTPAPAPVRSWFGRRKTDVEMAEPIDPGQGELFPAEPTTAEIPGLRPSRTPGVPGAAPSGAPDLASTGPIPKIVLPADEAEVEPLTAAQSALAWARFLAELVLALAVGVGVYYLFTVLWQLLPYLAVVAAPVAVTGLVGGVSAWRRSRGQPQLDLRVLLLLLFAATLLVIVPAAALLARS